MNRFKSLALNASGGAYQRPFSDADPFTIATVSIANPSGQYIIVRSRSNTNSFMNIDPSSFTLPRVLLSDIEFISGTTNTATVHFAAGFPE